MIQAEETPLPRRDDAPKPNPERPPSGTVLDNEHFVRVAFAASPRQGFEALFRLYYTPLCSHALRFVYRQDVAEDIVSELFYQLWKTEAYHAIQHSFRAYLYAAIRHRAYNYLRDELTGNRAPLPLESAALAGADDSPLALIEFDETFQRIERAIHNLPPQCQRVFLMSRFENRKNREIADELGLSLKTVEAHMARALHHLRRVFHTSLLFFF